MGGCFSASKNCLGGGLDSPENTTGRRKKKKRGPRGRVSSRSSEVSSERTDRPAPADPSTVNGPTGKGTFFFLSAYRSELVLELWLLSLLFPNLVFVGLVGFG